MTSPPPRRQLIALGLAAMLAPLSSTMIAVALPDIGRSLGGTPGELTLALVTSYLLAGIVAQSPGGKLGDLFGHGRALGAGQVLVGVGAVCGLVGGSLPLLVVARVLQATGGALIIPAAMALVRTGLPETARGRAYGLFGALMGAAAAIGPIVGGELVTRSGWRAVFAALLVPLALSAALAAGTTPPPPARSRPRFDLPGSVLLGLGLAGLVLAARLGAAFLAAGVVALVLFVAWERRAAEPVVALQLFRNRVFTASVLGIALQNLAMYGVLFQLPQFFIAARGVPSSVTGRTLLGMTLGMVTASLVGARLAERLGPRLTVAGGAVLSLAGLAWLSGLPSFAGPFAALAGLALLGLGVGASTAPLQTTAMNSVAREHSGMAAGVTSTVRYLGGVAAIAALGWFLDRPWPLADRHRAAIGFYGVSVMLSGVAAAFLPGRPKARVSS